MAAELWLQYGIKSRRTHMLRSPSLKHVWISTLNALALSLIDLHFHCPTFHVPWACCRAQDHRTAKLFFIISRLQGVTTPWLFWVITFPLALSTFNLHRVCTSTRATCKKWCTLLLGFQSIENQKSSMFSRSTVVVVHAYRVLFRGRILGLGLSSAENLSYQITLVSY